MTAIFNIGHPISDGRYDDSMCFILQYESKSIFLNDIYIAQLPYKTIQNDIIPKNTQIGRAKIGIQTGFFNIKFVDNNPVSNFDSKIEYDGFVTILTTENIKMNQEMTKVYKIIGQSNGQGSECRLFMIHGNIKQENPKVSGPNSISLPTRTIIPNGIEGKGFKNTDEKIVKLKN